MQRSVEECLIEYEMAESLNDINQNPAVTGLKAIGQGLVAEIPVLGTILTDTLDKGLEEFQNEKRRRLLESIVESTSIIAPERIAVVPYLVMKTAALGRGKAKDAYDIYFLIKHYHGGVYELAKEFSECGEKEIIKEMKETIPRISISDDVISYRSANVYL